MSEQKQLQGAAPGYLTELSMDFDSGSAALQTQLTNALSDLEANPSDPQKLATYQAKLSEYTLYRSAQSTTVKAYKDVAANILQNAR